MNEDVDYDVAEAHRRISNVLRRGVISAVQGATAQVQLEDGWTTDFLPVGQVHAGARWRSWAAPTVGEQVDVLSLSGETESGRILRGLNSDAMPAPSSDPDTVVLGAGDDGSLDTYNLATGARTLTLPQGGAFTVVIGEARLAMTAAGFTLAVGGDELTLKAGEVRTTTKTVLNNGSRPVAYEGGHDTAGNTNVDGDAGVLV